MADLRPKEEKPWLFKPGQSGNPKGRPKGTTDFKTKFRKAIEALAEKNEITGDELELQIIQKGIASARKGDYKFYKDLFDRVYGKPQQNVDVVSGGEPLQIIPAIADKYGVNTSTVQDNNGQA